MLFRANFGPGTIGGAFVITGYMQFYKYVKPPQQSSRANHESLSVNGLPRVKLKEVRLSDKHPITGSTYNKLPESMRQNPEKRIYVEEACQTRAPTSGIGMS